MIFRFTQIQSLSILMILLSSCDKVIDLKLGTSSSQLVIQGNIYNHQGPYTVNLSKSVNFDQSNIYPPVSGAIVIISDHAGSTDTLTETSPGTFQTRSLLGVPGKTYYLSVITGGKLYTANSTIPFPVKIDSVFLNNSMFSNEKLINVSFSDPASTKNYYRLVEFINDTLQADINIVSDKIYNGDLITYTFGSHDSNRKLQKGDKVRIWLESVDEKVYEYFRTAGMEGRMSASPANPVSNVTNGALGYFNACSYHEKTIIVN